MATETMGVSQQTGLLLIQALRTEHYRYLRCWDSRIPCPHHLLSRGAITPLREAGLRVILRHEEREEALGCLLDLGVDEICRTDPERSKNLRDRA